MSDNMERKEEEMQKDVDTIIFAVMKTYNVEMAKFLRDKASGAWKESDVIIAIMNVTTSISTMIYYSIKDFVANPEVDYEFLRVKLINSLVESFDKIKSYKPLSTSIAFSEEFLHSLINDGAYTVIADDGSKRLVKREDLGLSIDELKEELSRLQLDKLNASDNKIH